jgi:4-hydroxy-tetrahydrodipicolinate synthase
MRTRNRAFRGAATALVTPFTSDGEVDEKSLRALVDFQVRGGIDAIVPCGTTGENPTLTKEEHRRVFDIVVEQAHGRVKVFAGSGSNSTRETIEKVRLARDAGADAALIVGPYYNKPTQEGYFQHYRTVAEAVDIPIIVYNVPGRTGGNIEASTVLRLAEEVPAIRMVKEASGNMQQIMEIARHKPAGFSLLSGDDALTLPIIAVGGDGCISVVANEVPAEFSRMVHAALKDQWKKARELNALLLTLMNANFVESNPIPVKAALAMMGRIEEVYRLPLVPLSAKHRPTLERVLRDMRLLRGTGR